MSLIKVGVLRGGPSSEYDVSLRTGASVLRHLPAKYHPFDIYIDKSGQWNLDGIPVMPTQVFKNTDVLFNAMHGTYGEDGTVQRLCEIHGAAMTGSGSLASSLGMNKGLSKKVFKAAGLNVPYGVIAEKGESPEDVAKNVFETFSGPWIVKPVNGGSSDGIFLAKNIPELERSAERAFGFSDQILIEELLNGKEVTCGVVENFRGEEHYALLPIEIRKTGSIFNRGEKYEKKMGHKCPACLNEEEKKRVQDAAILAHRALGLKHYSRTDMILRPNGSVYVLETNSLPGLTETSLVPMALNAVGCNYSQFLDHLVGLALNK